MPTALLAQGLGKNLLSVLRGETKGSLWATPTVRRTCHPSPRRISSLRPSPWLWFGRATVSRPSDKLPLCQTHRSEHQVTAIASQRSKKRAIKKMQHFPAHL